MADMARMSPLNPSILALIPAALLCANGGAVIGNSAAENHQGVAANAAIVARSTPPVPLALPSAGAVVITKSPDGLFYVMGTINGTPVRFLVDTGANMVVLTADDARRAGVPFGEGRSADSIQTAGGQSRMDRISLNHVSVAGRDVANIDAAVMQDGLKVSLLGQNLLSKLGAITLSGDQITLHSSP
jgi:aspartyl protease family protein